MKSKVSFLFFFLLVVIVPLFYSELVMDNALLPKFIALSIVLTLGGIYLLRLSDRLVQEIKWMDLLLIVYAFSALPSAVFAVNKMAFLYEFLKILLFIITYFHCKIYFLHNKEQSISAIIKACLVASILAIVFSLPDFSEALKTRENFSATVYLIEGKHGHRNLLSNWILLLIPFTFLGLKKEIKWPKMLFIFGLIAQIIIILLLRTRATYIGLMLMALTVLLAYFKPKILKPAFSTTLVVFCLAIIFTLFTPVVTNLLSDLAGETGSISERLIVWEKTIPMVKEHWLFGVGLGNWKLIFPEQGLDGLHRALYGNTVFARPHNDFLWTFVESGIIGIGSFIGIITLAISAAVNNITQQSKTPWLTILSLAGVLAYMGVSFFDFPKERIEHRIILAILLAFLGTIPTEKSNIKLPFKVSIKLLTLLGIVIGSFSAYFGFNRYQSETFIRKAIVAKDNGNYLLMKQHAIAANNFWIKADNNGIPIKWYEGVANFQLNEMDQAYVNFEEAFNLCPNDVNVLNNVGTVYFLKNDFQNAILFYKKVLNINPENENSKLNLVSAYVRLGEWKLASIWYNQLKLKSERTENLRVQIEANL